MTRTLIGRNTLANNPKIDEFRPKSLEFLDSLAQGLPSHRMRRPSPRSAKNFTSKTPSIFLLCSRFWANILTKLFTRAEWEASHVRQGSFFDFSWFLILPHQAVFLISRSTMSEVGASGGPRNVLPL